MADAPLTVGDLLEVRFEGQILSNRWNNVIHVAVTVAPSNPDAIYDNLKVLSSNLLTAYYNAIGAELSNVWTLDLCRVKRIRPTASVFAFSADPTAGTVVTGIDEPDDAVVCRLYTSQAGRSRQGRIYIAGIPDADVVSGILDATTASELADQLLEFFVGPIMGSNGMEVHCYVWSPKLSNDGDPATLAAYPVTNVFIDRVVRRMTRRDFKTPILQEGA